MQYLPKFRQTCNSADPANAIRQKREAFAAGLARYEFGARNYRGEDHDGFVDRPPGLIAVLRAARWQGAER